MESSQLSPQQFQRFRDFIYQQSGIRIDVSKITLLSNRIRRRLKATGCADFDAYYRRLASAAEAGELGQFLDAVTTNETHFFRTPNHFDWFKDEFLPAAITAEFQGKRRRSLRIWSAACSTGEEAYSLAICLAESAIKLPGWNLKVVGTDISEGVLREARLAEYAPRSLELVAPALLKRYFDPLPGDKGWQARPLVKKLVEFRRHNLMEPLGLAPFDCIFIRNVLIYFDRDSKRVVIDHLIRSLASGGYLVVGPSEGIYDMLAPLEKRATFLYQKT